MHQVDKVVPNEDGWEFDEEVTACFDDMLSRSIPGYTDMRNMALSIARATLLSTTRTSSTSVLDLGASRGSMLAPLVEEFNDTIFVALDISQPMLAVMRDRFKSNANVRVLEADLRDADIIPTNFYDVVFSVLTLQFVPIEHRPALLKKIYDNLSDGGVFIFVEKVIDPNADMQKLFSKCYYNFKEKNGYSPSVNEAKRLSLETKMYSVTESMNLEMLKAAGFKTVSPFFRNYNFCGWIAIA